MISAYTIGQGDRVMREKRGNIAINSQQKKPNVPSALDLWRFMGGKSHQVSGQKGRRPPDSMIAVLGDRVTYTFILDDEVASIHFDRRRGEIFFKGHNINHMELTGNQLKSLEQMKGVLADDEKARKILPDYSATLARCLADK